MPDASSNNSDTPENEPTFLHDPAFKNLFMDFPAETVSWLLPKAIEQYGPLKEVHPLRQEQQKRWLSDKGRELDIPLLCVFKKKKLIITLIEHQQSKKAFSIYKLAHYTLDLMEANAGIAVIPIVVFTDHTKWRTDVLRELRNEALDQEWLQFKFQRVKLKEFKARDMQKQLNPVIQILIMNFDYKTPDKVPILKKTLLHLWNTLDPLLCDKYFDFLHKYGKLSPVEDKQLKSELKKEPDGMTLTESFKKEGLKEGLKKGLEKGLDKGIKEGLEKGLDKGIKEGLEKAKQESVKNQKKTLTDILTLRFGALDQALQKEIDQIESEKLLGKLLVSAATVKKLDQFKLK